MPTDAAFTRIGMSLETRTTSRPSADRLRATARIRESLSAPSSECRRNPAGSTDRSAVVELDVQRAAAVADRYRIVQPTVLDAQVVEHAERLPGEPAKLRVVPLPLQLADHDERQDDLVLTEAAQCSRVGEQHAGVEDVRLAGFGRAAVGHRPSLEATHQRPVSKVRHAHVGAGAGPLAVECSTRQGLPGGVPVRSATEPNGTTPGRRDPRTSPNVNYVVIPPLTGCYLR